MFLYVSILSNAPVSGINDAAHMASMTTGTTETTSSLERYLAEISDPVLRENLAREIGGLKREFGLVFERHHPEGIRLPKHAVKRGSKVVISGAKDSVFYRVHRLNRDAGTGIIVDSDGNQSEHPVASLTVAKEFGDVMYPGLRKLSEIRRGDPDAPVHTIINGENYHALEALQYTHAGNVDVIYIDPPYNTGNSEWKYNDRYVDGNDGYRHSKWLSFMEKRLRVAKSLLKDSGVLFMSIDDNEQARLKVLADQVFGEENFVETIMVEMSATQGMKVAAAKRGTMVKNGEFVHVYRKSDLFDSIPHTPLFDGVEGYDAHYSYWLADDTSHVPLSQQLMAEGDVRSDIERLGLARGGRFTISDMDALIAGSPSAARFVRENAHRIMQENNVSVPFGPLHIPKGHYVQRSTDKRDYLLIQTGSGTIRQLIPLSDNLRLSDDYRPRFGRTVIRGDFWKGFHRDMVNVSKEGGIAFPNGKKPIRLVKQLIRWANNDPNAVVLDFFAGSGSTGHAVMEMNAEDGGTRQAILVTNNELSKADDAKLRKAGHAPGDDEYEALGVFHHVTKPRLETVVTGIREDGSTYSAGLDANIAFFELTYLDEPDIVRGAAFNDLAGLFWLKAGGHGGTVELTAGAKADGFAISESGRTAVLFTPGRAQALAEKLAATEHTISHLFIVTDSEAQGDEAATHFPGGITVERIYGSYLEAFQVNRKD